MKTYSVQLRNDCNLMNDNYVGTLEECIKWCRNHGKADALEIFYIDDAKGEAIYG